MHVEQAATTHNAGSQVLNLMTHISGKSQTSAGYDHFDNAIHLQPV